MTFQTMRLAEPVARAVEDEGYETPTPIQAQTIPEAMTGRDVLGCAQTGTGKTCAFALPILHQLATSDAEYQMPRKARRGRPPRALVLCPTRELAMQIHESFETYGRHLELRHAVIYGGVKQGRQVNALRYGVDVLIATPGRLLDLVNQGHVDLSEIQSFVLDEADRMLDMGFIDDIRKVVNMIPNKHQTLFFSATVSNDIRRLADSLLRDPLKIETAPEATTVDKIDQCVFMVKRDDKPQALCALLERDSVECALVFTKTKHGADRLVRHLKANKYRSDAIHSDKAQNKRIDIMNSFRSGRISVLVATDIAARGIDVDGITHVVNYDLPMESETYVHRIGRTARAGASGIAVTFCDKSERRLLQAVERRTRKPLNVSTDLKIPPRAEKKNYDKSPTGRYEEKKKRFDEKFDRKLAQKFGSNDSTSDSGYKKHKKKDKKKFKKNFDGNHDHASQQGSNHGSYQGSHQGSQDRQGHTPYKPASKPAKWAPRNEGDAPKWKPAPRPESRERNEESGHRVDGVGNPWQKKNAQNPGKKKWDGNKSTQKPKWGNTSKPKPYGKVNNRDERPERSESGERKPWEKSYQKGGKPGWKSKHPYSKGDKRSRDGDSGGSRDARDTRDNDRASNKPWTPKPKSQGVPWKPKGKYKPSGGKPSGGSGGYGERSERSDRGGSKPWSEGTRGNSTRKPNSGAPKHQWKNPKGNASSDGGHDARGQGHDDGGARNSGQGKWKPGGFKSGGPKPGGFKSGGKSGGPKRGGVKSSGPRSGGFKSANGKPGGFKSGGPKRGGTTNRYSTASRNRTSGRGVRG